MARVLTLRVQNYRSIGAAIEVNFPANKPLVLLGQNNAGKSNIIKALDLILGQSWAGSHDPEDHECFNRDRNNPIQIDVEFTEEEPFGGRYERVRWRYNKDEEIAVLRVLREYAVFPVLGFYSIQDFSSSTPECPRTAPAAALRLDCGRATGLDVKPVLVRL